MIEITPEYWSLFCGDMPMPERATYDMMIAASQAIEEMERRDEAVEYIAFFSGMLERDKERLKEAQEWGDEEKVAILQNIINTTNQIINMLRERLQ